MLVGRPPRLLFFAYAFPPSRAVGAVRCWNVAKHLARCGWDVEVVTLAPELLANPQPGVDVRVNCAREHIRLRSTGCDWMFLTAGHTQLPRPLLRFPAKVVRQVPKWLGWEPMLGWQAAAVRACAPLRPGDADMVLASAPPYTGFSAAAIVAQRLLSPLILDYREIGRAHV